MNDNALLARPNGVIPIEPEETDTTGTYDAAAADLEAKRGRVTTSAADDAAPKKAPNVEEE